MILEINFPDNLITGLLPEQKNIPCTIKVADKFEVIFSTVVPCTAGIMHEWDRQRLEERAIAKAGGAYTHNEPALITLNKKTKDSYEVVDLYVFYNDFGWCPVIKDGEYAIPNQFWDSDEEDPDYIPKN
ncbi:hypothetical protein ACP26C_00915 [Franconibacter helveticus 513]|uniref:hypothetical protein n=1 Tax=Franconibacter helveticus TaxID=357240 RepID=UPI0004655F84|nr:hypothetical protein [Franconibacter helveticus]